MSSLPAAAKSKIFYIAGISVIYGLFVTFFSLSSGYLDSQEKVLSDLYKYKKVGSRSQMYSMTSGGESVGPSRGIASVEPVKVDNKADLTELSEFYFSRYRELAASGNSKQALRTLTKLQKFSTEIEVQMKSSYFKAVHYCTASQEKKCLKEVDYMVTQSPDNEWTGRALVLLAQHYAKVDRLSEVLLLKDVVKMQFQNSSVVMKELNRLKL